MCQRGQRRARAVQWVSFVVAVTKWLAHERRSTVTWGASRCIKQSFLVRMPLQLAQAGSRGRRTCWLRYHRQGTRPFWSSVIGFAFEQQNSARQDRAGQDETRACTKRNQDCQRAGEGTHTWLTTPICARYQAASISLRSVPSTSTMPSSGS